MVSRKNKENRAQSVRKSRRKSQHKDKKERGLSSSGAWGGPSRERSALAKARGQRHT
jgi:hypothetical protein